ncbi:hypothetical protein [Bartonella sp. TT121SHDZB]|uniref:hypothetical protein n=1 Tax=Bartonella sp. TT121SHDZB TaxID=3243580 RepID=UPI0035D0D068
MALFPFSIADIDDPEHIRVVLYASGRMGHAPLNALLKKAYEDITKISKRMDALEKKLNTLDLTNVKQKQNAKEGKRDSLSHIVNRDITMADVKMGTSELKIASSSDMDLSVPKLTPQKTLEIYSNADQEIVIQPSRNMFPFFKKKKYF